jgi:UDP-N-acetylglucosamine 2-epimerase (non-hydrolysing)
MSNARIAIVNGTKAQLIKMAPVLIELEKRRIAYDLIYTGQHSETFSDLEMVFGLRPADDVMVPCFEASTKRSFLLWSFNFWLAAVKRILSKRWHKFSIVVVHGDTASTLYASLAMRMAGVKVAHVEAGLRSPDIIDPFPEEIIRRLVSKLASVHFAPDLLAVAALFSVRGEIVLTHGNTMRDCLRIAVEKSAGQMKTSDKKYVIFSIHRNENLSNSEIFNYLMNLLINLSQKINVKFVLHPATRERMHSNGWIKKIKAEVNIEILDRMDYFSFVDLMIGSKFICTDGGSNQEEAAMLGLPALILRKTTERQDGLDENVVLSNFDNQRIENFFQKYLREDWDIKKIQDARPSDIIVDRLSMA